MNTFKICFYSGLLFIISSCGGGNVTASQLFDIQIKGGKNQFQQNETIEVSIKNKKGKTINNVTYSIDGKNIEVANNKLTLNVPSLGNKVLKASISYEDHTGEIEKNIKVLAQNAPAVYTYSIVNEFPHDNTSYTQGLEFHQDTLYESTGKKGRSYIRKVNFETGEVLKQVDLDKVFFGEGITILNDKIYQLTWQGGTGFTYNLSDFTQIGSFKYGQSKEGWGLCNDGTSLYKSDGTEKIWILNPDTLIEEGHIETVTNKSIFNRANELEYVDGKIYANVYGKESMMIIDATSGAIEGVINFGGLKKKITKGADWDDVNYVLNGVAYNPNRKTFFVTGKHWDKLFEVTISKKE